MKKLLDRIMAVGALVAGLGFIMGQVAVGQRGLIGWLAAICTMAVAALVVWRRIQRHNDPPPSNDRERQRARKRSEQEVIFLLSCLVVIPIFLWTASADQGTFEATTVDIFMAGTAAFLVAGFAKFLLPENK